MAILSDEKRIELWKEIQSSLSEVREPCAVNKADLRAAVNALDSFFSDNAATINAAIPQPARSDLTTSQKARLLMLILKYRFVEGS